MFDEAPAAAAAPRETRVRTWMFAAARIGLGLYWLYEQHWKLPPDFGLHQPKGLMYAFQISIQHPTIGIYGDFLQQVVVPHFHLFGWLVFLGETVIGLLLILGLLTRLAALLGTLEAINLLVSQGATPEGPALYLAILAANLFVLVTVGNRVWSLDRLLATRLGLLGRQSALLGRVLAAATGRGLRQAGTRQER